MARTASGMGAEQGRSALTIAPRCPPVPPPLSATADPAFSRKPRCAQVERTQQCRCEPGFHMSGTAAASLCQGKRWRGRRWGRCHLGKAVAEQGRLVSPQTSTSARCTRPRGPCGSAPTPASTSPAPTAAPAPQGTASWPTARAAKVRPPASPHGKRRLYFLFQPFFQPLSFPPSCL